MFSREFRPLKRPKLGIPDYYPQEEKQKEVNYKFPEGHEQIYQYTSIPPVNYLTLPISFYGRIIYV